MTQNCELPISEFWMLFGFALVVLLAYFVGIFVGKFWRGGQTR